MYLSAKAISEMPGPIIRILKSVYIATTASGEHSKHSTHQTVKQPDKALYPPFLPPLRCGKTAGELGRYASQKET